jgi:hypothetical protein
MEESHHHKGIYVLSLRSLKKGINHNLYILLIEKYYLALNDLI